LRAVGTLIGFVSSRNVPLASFKHSVTRGLSPTREKHAAVSRLTQKMESKRQLAALSLFAEGSRQGHFFGFAFFAADFLAAFFAPLFPLPMSALAAW
jgi:hypothetical protein